MVKVWKSALLGFRHPQHQQKNDPRRTRLLFSMWNVQGTDSILKHCFNGQEHKSLSDTENNRQQQSQNRIRTHYGLLVLWN